MAENIKSIIDSFAQVLPPIENGTIHITDETRKQVFEIWGSELWIMQKLSAREVRKALEYANDNYFVPSFNVSQFNTMCFHLFVSNAAVSPECWERDFPFVFAASSKSGVPEYKVDFKLLAFHIIKSGKYIFVKDTIYLYDDLGVYKLVCNDVFRGYIMSYVNSLDCTLAKTSGIDGAVRDVKSDDSHRIDDLKPFNADTNIINFQNGILHLDTIELTPHSPDILSTIQIPCNWNTGGEIPACPIFDSYLNTLANGDEEIVRFLWQYIGATISNIPGHVTKSALFLYGAGNTGKSQFLELLSRLVGKGNFASIELKKLEERFGAFSILHKRLAGSPDMSFAKVAEMQIFKKLTGGDDIDFEQKGKDTITDKYRGMLLFCCNDLPKFGGDKGDNVYERMIIIPCNNIIPPEKRDPAIVDKMYAEKAAIVYKAVQALKQFIANGFKFDIPAICEKETQRYKLDNDNVMMFLDECTMLRIGQYTGYRDDACDAANMYTAYIRWIEENGEQYQAPKSEFISTACRFYGFNNKDDIKHKYNGKRFYKFTLKPDHYSLIGHKDLPCKEEQKGAV